MPKRVTSTKKVDATKNQAAQKSMELLVAYAQGEYTHLNRGSCPDVYGFAKRDAECVVCQALDAVNAAMKKSKSVETA